MFSIGARASEDTSSKKSEDASSPKAKEDAASPKGAPAPDDAHHRSEIFYLHGEAGAEYAGLETLHLTNTLLPSTDRAVDVGPAVEVGAGLRIFVVTIGPSFRYAFFRDWDLWTLDGEIGLHAPIGKLEIFALLGGGYAKVGQLPQSNITVAGYDLRIGGGADYYVTNSFSVGGIVTGEVLGLARPGVDLNQSTGSVVKDVLAYDSSSIGVAMMVGPIVGLHL